MQTTQAFILTSINKWTPTLNVPIIVLNSSNKLAIKLEGCRLHCNYYIICVMTHTLIDIPNIIHFGTFERHGHIGA